MKEQLTRRARRVPAALAVLVCAALLLIPVASRASGQESRVQSTPVVIHTADTAVIPHAARVVSVHLAIDLAGVPADSSSYLAVATARPVTQDRTTATSAGDAETFRERAPPV